MSGNTADEASGSAGTFRVKAGLAKMLKGGVIMDVVNAEQARIAEEAGAVAVMALERIPADIRVDGGVARMSDPDMIRGIKAAVTIPVMAKARIGHFVEAQILEAIEVDYIDESEVLSMADDEHHLNKTKFTVPFVCGCRDLGEALRRIAEGAAMLRTKGEAGTGNVVEAVRHARAVNADIRRLKGMDDDELFVAAKNMRAPYDLVKEVAATGSLPVVNFAAGGVATPADAALMMQLGLDGVFVGSGIFKSEDPAKRARAIVQAVTHFNDAKKLAEYSTGALAVGVLDPRCTPKGLTWRFESCSLSTTLPRVSGERARHFDHFLLAWVVLILPYPLVPISPRPQASAPPWSASRTSRTTRPTFATVRAVRARFPRSASSSARPRRNCTARRGTRRTKVHPGCCLAPGGCWRERISRRKCK